MWSDLCIRKHGFRAVAPRLWRRSTLLLFNQLGITPDFHVRINRELLDEVDGRCEGTGCRNMHVRMLALPHRTVRPALERDHHIVHSRSQSAN